MSVEVTEPLRQVEPFSGLDKRELSCLAELCELLSVRPGEQVVRAGQRWDGLYFVMSGEVRLVNDKVATDPITIDTLSEGASFGERGLFSGDAAEFSVYVNGLSTILLKLPKGRLDDFLARNQEIEREINQFATRQAIKSFLSKSTIFAVIPPERLARLARFVSRKELETGELLIREGDRAEELYIIEEGRFNVYQGKDAGTILTRLQRGDIVGEIALVTGSKRTATVVAETPSCVLVLPGAEFLALYKEQKQMVGSIDELIRQRSERSKLEVKTKQKRGGAKPEAAGEAAAFPSNGYKVPLKYRLGRLPAIRQQSAMDCGAACLAIVCRYYGKRVSLNRMREMARVGRSGASMLNLMRTAETLGYETSPVLATYDHLMESHLPAIVNWRGYHWMVVYRVTPTEVTLADPAAGLSKMSKEEFLEGWSRYTLYLRPTEKFKELEQSKPSLEQFKPYIKPYRRLLTEIFLASLSIQILQMFLPLFTKFVIDEVIMKQKDQWLVYSLVAISCIVAFNLGISFCRQQLLLLVSMKIALRMASDFYQHVLSLPLPFFESRKVGDITSRFNENEKITQFLTRTGMQSFLDMITAVLYLGLMFYFNIALTLVACVFVAVQIFIVYFMTPRFRHAYRDVMQKNADVDSYLIESLKGMSTIKTMGVEHMTRWSWENLYTSFTNSFFKTIKYGTISSLTSGLANHLSDVAVLFIGAALVLENRLTVGELVAFSVLTKGLSAPITALVHVWDEFQNAVNSVERINDVFETKPELIAAKDQEKIGLPTLRGHIELSDVTFRYEAEAKNNVLQNFSLKVEPGRRIAFVGRSGSGKSTLIKLICGFYQPTSGSILVDGFNIADAWLPSLRQQIGVVPQQSYLFRGTIRENISKAKPEASIGEIVEAARLAGAHDFISSFPKGYDTVLEEQGSNLSGGQRQRVAIARALVQDPRILILDEATSALDNESERFVQRNIDTVFRDRTVFMIAHRLSTVRDADLIVVVDKGNILEQGTHQQLMAKKGLYYFLSTQQLNL